MREIVNSSEDCRFAADDKGVPAFYEGLAWRLCGEFTVVRWVETTVPPTPVCATTFHRK